VDALYREVLQYDGRDDAAAAKLPSETVWKGVEARQLLTLADAYRITLAQGEQVARAAEGFLQSLAVQDQMVASILPRLDVQGTQFFQDRVPGVVHVGCHDDVLHPPPAGAPAHAAAGGRGDRRPHRVDPADAFRGARGLPVFKDLKGFFGVGRRPAAVPAPAESPGGRS